MWEPRTYANLISWNTGIESLIPPVMADTLEYGIGLVLSEWHIYVGSPWFILPPESSRYVANMRRKDSDICNKAKHRSGMA
jgi:hypothetical protein